MSTPLCPVCFLFSWLFCSAGILVTFSSRPLCFLFCWLCCGAGILVTFGSRPLRFVLLVVLWCLHFGHLRQPPTSLAVLLVVLWCWHFGHLRQPPTSLSVLLVVLWCWHFGHLRQQPTSLSVLLVVLWCWHFGHLRQLPTSLSVLLIVLSCWHFGHLWQLPSLLSVLLVVVEGGIGARGEVGRLWRVLWTPLPGGLFCRPCWGGGPGVSLVFSVFFSSWCLGRAVFCDCGTPWTFLLPYILLFVASWFILRGDLF